MRFRLWSLRGAGMLERPEQPIVIVGVWSRRTKIGVVAVTALAALLLLFAARDILSPFIWAFGIAYLLSPLLSLANRRVGLPRPVLVLILYAIGINVIFWTVWLVRLPLARELSELVESIPRFATWVREQIAGTDSFEFFGQTFVVDDVVADFAEPLRNAAAGLSRRLFELAIDVITAFLKVLLALVAAFYLLLAGPRIVRRVLDLFPATQRPEVESLVVRLDRVLAAFIRGEFLLVVIMATATYIGLTVIGIPFALLLAVITGFLELIPLVGPVAAALPPVLLALFGTNAFGWPGWVAALVVAAMYTVLRHVEDYLVIPNVIGRAVQIHPFMVIFAVAVGASVWGISGMIFAVPVAAMAKVVLGYVHKKLVAEG